MKQKIFTKYAIIAVTLATMAIVGCGKEKAEISQGITPNVLNFYILHQEIEAVRDKVGISGAGEMAQYRPAYNELLGRSQKMLKDNETSKELKKYPEINSTMDSCLNAGVEFLTLEAKAVETNNELADVKQQLTDIRRSIRNNSMLARKQGPKINALAEQQSRLQKQLDSYKPVLSRNSQACIRFLKKYNKLIMQDKILEFANDEKLFALFPWEKPAGAKKPATKTVRKKRK